MFAILFVYFATNTFIQKVEINFAFIIKSKYQTTPMNFKNKKIHGGLAPENIQKFIHGYTQRVHEWVVP